MEYNFKGYKTSRDYTKLKELLDSDYSVILVWIHSTTLYAYAEVAHRVFPIPGGVDGYWYNLGIWNYFPGVNRESFEDYCKKQGFFYIVPQD